MQTSTGQQQRTDLYRGPVSLPPNTDQHTATDQHIAPNPAAKAAPNSAPNPAATSAPIFVDASGRRRKLARRASLAAVAVLAGYAGLLAVSFAGGPIPPNALLPVPGVPSGHQQAPASTAPAQAASSAKAGAEHTASGSRSTPGGLGYQDRSHTAASTGSAGQSAPSQPRPTAPAGSSASSAGPSTPAPTPTGTLPGTPTSSTRGNPTAPGHTRHKSPSPSQTT